MSQTLTKMLKEIKRKSMAGTTSKFHDNRSVTSLKGPGEAYNNRLKDFFNVRINR